MLSVIKDLIERINKVYQPIGFNLYIGARDESKDHFHMHIAPKYKKGYCLLPSIRGKILRHSENASS